VLPRIKESFTVVNESILSAITSLLAPTAPAVIVPDAHVPLGVIAVPSLNIFKAPAKASVASSARSAVKKQLTRKSQSSLFEAIVVLLCKLVSNLKVYSPPGAGVVLVALYIAISGESFV